LDLKLEQTEIKTFEQPLFLYAKFLPLAAVMAPEFRFAYATGSVWETFLVTAVKHKLAELTVSSRNFQLGLEI
jgi:hypothetical protein